MTTTNKAGEILCDCCDLDIASCGKQAEGKQLDEQREHRKRLRQRGWFAAQWPAPCDQCGEYFKPNDLIQFNGRKDGRNVYVAECCAPEV